MAVRGYILVETDVGQATAVSQAASALNFPGCRVVSSCIVTGPYDVILHLEADDLHLIGTCLLDAIGKLAGVQRTTTCLAVRLG